MAHLVATERGSDDGTVGESRARLRRSGIETLRHGDCTVQDDFSLASRIRLNRDALRVGDSDASETWNGRRRCRVEVELSKVLTEVVHLYFAERCDLRVLGGIGGRVLRFRVSEGHRGGKA